MSEVLIADWKYFVCPFVIGLVLGAGIIPRMMLVSIKSDWARKPGQMLSKGYSAVQIAGLSLFPVLLLTLCVSFLLTVPFDGTSYSKAAYHMVPRMLQLIAGAAVLFTAGLKYDMNGLSSLLRLFAIITASALFSLTGICITDLHGIFDINEIPMWMGVILTTLLAVAIVEMFKLLDGMDGLASGMAVAVLIAFLPIFSGSYIITPAVVVASTLGVVLPFWFMKLINKDWAKAMMGNSGSYVVGYIVAYVFIYAFSRSGTVYPAGTDIVAMAALALPALDTVRVLGSRARDGRSLLMPDRNQLNFKVLRTGMPRLFTVPLLMFIVLCFTSVTMLMVGMEMDRNIIIVVGVMLWIFTELMMNFFIRRKERNEHQSEWNKIYGEDVWNANIPYEQLEEKRRVFGTMGLPEQYVEGQQDDFISDGMNFMEKTLKRLTDIIISVVMMVVFSPFYLLSYMLIKLDDGGPAIYKQERIGRFGQPFRIYKFRSMRIDAEQGKPQLSHSCGDGDPRLTKIGSFLRAHHLDELPQLWNVFVGDMSFIGYRPERQFFIDKIMKHDPRYAFLYQIRPGVTSYATLYNGYTDTMEKMLRRLELDLYYLRHRSWWMDTKILFLTFTSIIFGKKF